MKYKGVMGVLDISQGFTKSRLAETPLKPRKGDGNGGE